MKIKIKKHDDILFKTIYLSVKKKKDLKKQQKSVFIKKMHF